MQSCLRAARRVALAWEGEFHPVLRRPQPSCVKAEWQWGLRLRSCSQNHGKHWPPSPPTPTQGFSCFRGLFAGDFHPGGNKQLCTQLVCNVSHYNQALAREHFYTRNNCSSSQPEWIGERPKTARNPNSFATSQCMHLRQQATVLVKFTEVISSHVSYTSLVVKQNCVLSPRANILERFHVSKPNVPSLLCVWETRPHYVSSNAGWVSC